MLLIIVLVIIGENNGTKYKKKFKINLILEIIKVIN